MTLNEKIYSMPLKSVFDTSHGRLQEPFFMLLRLSIPLTPKEAHGTFFAEHVYDRKLKSATPNVILTGRSCIVESKDNGVTWTFVPIPEVETRILYNCFTTDEGNHIVQAKPEELTNNALKKTNPQRATLFLFSPDWKLLSVDDSPQALWHGRASIDQSGDTIMFAEYHANQSKYLPLYRDDYTKWRPLMKVSRVYRSQDGGGTWEIVFEAPPELIRHFHTLQADPFLPKTWWLSSGDQSEESRVWRSNDDGNTWIDVTHPNPEILLPKTFSSRRQAAFRYTDLIISEDSLIWGADDILGSSFESSLEFEQKARAGSRIYRTLKSNPLQIEELGYVGHPVRSIIDIGPAYLFITEANRAYYPLKPQVIVLFKDSMDKPIEVARIDNFKNKKTGFTFSKASKAALNGRFFSYRDTTDVFNNIRPLVLQWDVEFSS